MLAYWLLFALFAIGAVVATRHAYMPALSVAKAPVPRVPGPSSAGIYGNGTMARNSSFAPPAPPFQPNKKGLLLASLVPIILIGFRYQVGSDYLTYASFFQKVSHSSLQSALKNSDAGYAALNWLVAEIGGKLWLVNLVCGILFTFGLVKFAKTQPNPWLAITIAIPYLVITVGMGLSRQAVAIGMGMAGLAGLTKGSYAKFAVYVLIGSLFHRSAVVLLPIVGLSYSRNRLMAVAVAVVGSAIGYYVLTSGSTFERFEGIYIRRALFESAGAPVRLAMNVPPAALFLLYAKRFAQDPREWLTYMILSLISLISLALLVAYPAASTPIDRMALYVIPLQVFVLSRLPSLYPNQRGFASGPLTAAIILYSAAVEFVWLNYATFARDWVPYQFVPLKPFG